MPIRLGPLLAETPIGMGVLGALVTSSNAAAKNVHLVRTGASSRVGAAVEVGNETLKSVVVTTAGVAIVTGIGGGLLTSLGATLLIGTVGKYAWDRGYGSVTVKRRRTNR